MSKEILRPTKTFHDGKAWPVQEPAQRKPLTSEEVSDLRIKHGITSNGRGIKEFTQIVDFVRAIEAKLKEKNT